MKTQNNYNPDVLSCLANLSSDEVFTPPKIVNEVLDLLPKEIWKNKNATFLDPACKSGVFLREIAKRLLKGLKYEIPDVQKRIDHIYKNQLFGIGITELTSLLSRRSLYCSKKADGKYSVSGAFKNGQGNIFFERTNHTWKNNRCIYCGASQSEYEREEGLETYAYQFIHNKKPNIINNMKFDVIIGNPPYQLSDGGGTGSSAIPIYNKFVQQAKKLNPRFLIMIIPSRWFTGGRALDEFRSEMLNDIRIKIIHDYLNASDCFPGVEIKGGVCYFLWEKNHKGKCKIYTHENGEIIDESERDLLEEGVGTFIRHNKAISILKKVRALKEKPFSSIVSANDPFGFDIRVENSYKRIKPNFKKNRFKDSVEFYYNGWRKEGLGYIAKKDVKKNHNWMNGYKVLIPKAWGVGNAGKDWLNPFIVGPNSCCSETYLVVGPFVKRKIAENAISYTQTKFFHLLLSLIKITQNTMKKAYSFIPLQNFNEAWIDEKLYKKYKLTNEEIEFIESMIRPMNKHE